MVLIQSSTLPLCWRMCLQYGSPVDLAFTLKILVNTVQPQSELYVTISFYMDFFPFAWMLHMQDKQKVI